MSSRPIVKTSELLYMHKVILYRKIMTNEPRLGPNDQLCLSKGLQEVALYWAYAHDSVGQLKVGATQKRMRARLFFSGMHNVTEKYFRGCHKCLRGKGESGRMDLPPYLTQRAHW